MAKIHMTDAETIHIFENSYLQSEHFTAEAVAAAYVAATAVLRAKVTPAPPLTLKELRGMDGEPVWVVFHHDADGEKLDRWALVDADCDDSYVYLESNIRGRTVFCCNEKLSGMTLCRRKPSYTS